MTVSVSQNLSLRAQQSVSKKNPTADGMSLASKNKYDCSHNPSGIVNLGVAENHLMKNELRDIMSTVDTSSPQLFGYTESPSGSIKLRGYIADHIFNRHFKPQERVLPQQMVLAAGCTAIIDIFTFCVCDPGDAILITTPFYTGFGRDIMAKAQGRVVAVDLGNSVPFDDVEHIQILQNAIDDARYRGSRVRAFLVTNPHNPLGRNFSQEVLIEYLKFANKNQLHILFDEIYALSVFTNDLHGPAKEEQPSTHPFMSVLAVPNIEQYCRKELIHVAYGLSKDFCLNGYRLGCLLSPWNEEMIDAVRSIAVFTWISSTTEAMALRLLSEPKTVDHFMRTNQKRLAQSYMVAATVLREHGIPFIPAQGGHFLWMDLRQFFPEHLAQAAKAGERGPEYVLWHAMLEEGVLLNPGEMFTESQVGFYRLTFSHPPETLRVGLDRMLKACKRLRMGDSVHNKAIY